VLEQALDHLYLYRAAKGLYLRAAARRVRRAGQAATTAVRGGDPTGRGARVPIAQYRENLVAIAGECRARGIRLGLLPLPLRRRPGDAPLESPYPAALAATARELGVPLLDIGPLAYGQAAADNDPDFIDSIHFSVSGASLMARTLAPQLAQLGLP